MSLKFLADWRFLIPLAAFVMFAAPAIPAQGQSTATTTTMISIDSPADGANVTNGTQVNIGGWSADTAGPGTGVDMVRVYLDGRMDAGGTLLGNANYGGSRPDVATALGSSSYTNSGFDFVWTPSNLSGGTHQIHVYAHSIANGWAYKTVSVTAPAQPTAVPARGQMGPGGPGGPPRPMTPYGGTFLNDQYGGYGGQYGTPCGVYDYYSACPQGGYGYPGGYPGIGYPGGGYPGFGYPGIGYPGGYPGLGGGLPYQQTVTVVAPPNGTIILSWIATPAAQNYRIYQATATSPTNFTVVQTISQTTGILATNATVAGLTPGQTYFFQVRSSDPNGLETVVPAYTASGAPGGFPGYPGYPGYPGLPGYPGALPAPSGVTVTGVTGTTATLQWAAVPGAVNYRVLQAVGNTGAFVPSVMSNSTSTSAVISGLTPSTLYSFQVVALDNFGSQSPPSVPVTVTTTAGP
jgi:hypothetical protein